MTIFSTGPYRDTLLRYNSILDLMSQAEYLARKNSAPQLIQDYIATVAALVFYEMKKIEAHYAPQDKGTLDG